MEDPEKSHLFVIFGGTGDLTQRKLLPAVYDLLESEEVEQEKCGILGVAMDKEYSDQDYRDWVKETLQNSHDLDSETFDQWCAERIFYHYLPKSNPGEFRKLGKKIKQVEKQLDLAGNRVFYLALPPTAFEPTLENLGKTGLNQGPGWTRVVIEKPFGRDLETAQHLNEAVHRNFEESQIYRIDHYLGKETVQNLLVFRFANAIFESLWNRNHIDSVQISVAEDLGIGHRAGYYDQAGALRDMVQNHVTQLLSLTAMEVPTAFHADAIRTEKVKVLQSIRPIQADDVVMGQYEKGQIDGETVRGYRDEEGIDPDSTAETFIAMKLDINNWRWQGVPFYIRTGKRLPRRLTRIVVRFRRPPVALFHSTDRSTMSTNTLVITIQPDEGVDLQFEVKTPGDEVEMQTHELGFRYGDVFGPIPDAYQTLLLDVLKGDQTLFVHADEVEASWGLYTPLLRAELPVHPYEAGTWGPRKAMALPDTYQQRWFMR